MSQTKPEVQGTMEATIARYKELLQTLLASPVFPFDDNLRNALPTAGGVYRIFETGTDWQDSVYIGKSTNLQNRVYGNHLMGNRRASTLKRKFIESGRYADENAVKHYLREKCSVQFITVDDDAERTSLEHFAVAIVR